MTPGSGKDLASVIEKASFDPTGLSSYGRSGREYVTSNYSREKIVKDYISEILVPTQQNKQ